MVNPSSRMVALFRVLRIVILIRIFRLASQKKQLEVVTRRMVSWSSNKSRQLLLFLIIFFLHEAINSEEQDYSQCVGLKLILLQKQCVGFVSLAGHWS